MHDILFYMTTAAYLAATFIYTGYLVSHRDKWLDTAGVVLYGAFAAHTLVLLTRLLMAGRTPATTLHESLTLFAWITVALYLVIRYRYKMSVLGAFVTPFALFLIVTASFLPKEIVPLAPALTSYWLPIHIVLAFVGNACFALAFLTGIMYLIQEHYLKSRKVGGLYFLLPSLELLDELNYRCLTYGFPMLTLAIITGAMWSQYAIGTYWIWEPRQIWSLITWFLYAALLHGRLVAGWRGRRAAILSGAAFLVLLGSFLMINLVRGGAHGY